MWVSVVIYGPLGRRRFRFILDTGTRVTTVDPEVLDQLGYNSRMGRRVSRSLGMGGVEQGYFIELSRVEAMGFITGPMEVVCADLPPGCGIDGLIGMDLLQHRVLTLDGIQGTIQVGT